MDLKSHCCILSEAFNADPIVGHLLFIPTLSAETINILNKAALSGAPVGKRPAQTRIFIQKRVATPCSIDGMTEIDRFEIQMAAAPIFPSHGSD